MKAKKLPSGSWRVRVFDFTDSNGKKHYKSFTSTDSSNKGKIKAERLASEYLLTKERAKRDIITLSEAWDCYVDSRSNVLSPSTVREYRQAKKNAFLSLMNKDIYEITQEDIQIEINELSRSNAPKTVRNKHGLISAILKMYRPEFVLNTQLPQKTRPSLHIPTESEFEKVLDYAKSHDHQMYIAILLGALAPMRRSEICGLKMSDIDGCTIHIQRAVVIDKDRQFVEKTTKTIAGNRFVTLPRFVIDQIKPFGDKVIDLSPTQITDRFEHIIKACDVPHFRFHDLRHYGASLLHSMNVPDSYIMERGGWGNASSLTNIYRHALSDKSQQINTQINSYFEKYDTKYDTKLKKP